MNATLPARGLRRVLVLLGVLLLFGAVAAAATWATPATEVAPSPEGSPAAEEPPVAEPAPPVEEPLPEAPPSAPPGEATAAPAADTPPQTPIPGEEPLVAGPAPETLGFSAGPVTPTWAHLIGDWLYDHAYDAAATARRTVYVTGNVCKIDNHMFADLSLAKYVDGAQVWLKRYDGPAGSHDGGTAIAARGTAIYTAGSRTTLRGDTDLLLIRWDANGKRVWTRAYDSGAYGDEGSTDVAVDGDGNVTVVGWSSPRGVVMSQDWVVISYRPDGTRRWVRRYDGPAHHTDLPSQMVVDAKGNVYVTGYSTSLRGDRDVVTIKYAKSGTRLWTRRYNGPANGSDYANALRLRPGGGVYVAGYADSVTSGRDGLLLAYTAAGTRLFVTLDPGPDPLSSSSEYFNDLELLPDGKVLCGGGTYSYWGDQYYARFDAASGAKLDMTVQGTAYTDTILRMGKDAQGGVYLCGLWGTGATTSQISVERIRAGGANWVSRWPVTPTGYNEPAAIAVNGVNAYVVGTHYVSPADNDQVLLAYVY
jgi:hypothetical protein